MSRSLLHKKEKRKGRPCGGNEQVAREKRGQRSHRPGGDQELGAAQGRRRGRGPAAPRREVPFPVEVKRLCSQAAARDVFLLSLRF